MSNGTTFPAYQTGGGGYNSDFSGEKSNGWQGGNNQGGGNGWKGKSGGGNDWKKPKPEEIDPTLYITAAFTGNKEAPQDILEKVKALAQFLESKGFTIRVGGDGPVEEAAEKAVSKKELILPWKGFAEKDSQLTWSIERAHHIAKLFHPTYDQLKKGVHGILAKNARLVMGHKMLSPSTVLVVWTADGVEKSRDVTTTTSFAGHPIKIANAAGIPVFNLGNPSAEQRLHDFVASMVV